MCLPVPGGTTLVDAHNGFNELSRLVMLWTVRHFWPVGARFVFICFRHRAQLFLRHPGDTLFILLIREGVTQGDPLLMVLYGITLVPLMEKLREADPTLSPTLYAYDTVSDGLAQRNAAQMRLLMDWGWDQGYFPDPANLLFIDNNPEEKESERWKFDRAGLQITYIDDSQYLGAYLDIKEELETWVGTKVEAWAHRVRNLAKIYKQYPQ